MIEPRGTVTVREMNPVPFVRCTGPSQRHELPVRTCNRYGRAPVPGRICPQSDVREPLRVTWARGKRNAW
jgi:hypothetical protein